MSPLIAFLVAIVILCVIGVGFAYLATRTKHVMNRNDRRLYKQAAGILNRLVNITDLDGDFAQDVISPATRKTIDDWLVAYRKEIEKHEA